MMGGSIFVTLSLLLSLSRSTFMLDFMQESAIFLLFAEKCILYQKKKKKRILIWVMVLLVLMLPHFCVWLF